MLQLPIPPMAVGDYHGFPRQDFLLEGRLGVVISPHTARPGMPWIWRAEFLGAFDTVDVAMLQAGFHLAYYQVSDMYGCPASIALMKGFYDFLTEQVGLARRTVLFGFSRGGLYAVNFAAQFPEAICALYLDAPVLDIGSWPGGLMQGEGAPAEYAQCLACYGLDADTIGNFHSNPLDKLPILHQAHIPIALVAGDADPVVPHTENAQLLADDYRAHGEKLLYILKPGCAHHPHSLEDPTPVVEFLLSCIA